MLLEYVAGLYKRMAKPRAKQGVNLQFPGG